MGSSGSKTCSYDKYEFNDMLKVIKDAHEVGYYYSKLLQESRLPIILTDYKNYNDFTEIAFNQKRKDVIPDMGISYYDLYTYIQYTLKSVYEREGNTEEDRRKIIKAVAENCFILEKSLIAELSNTCDAQK